MSITSTGLSRDERTGGSPGNPPPHLSGCDYIRTIKETAAILGVGEMSLRALIAKGLGPPIVRLSARRIGVRDSARENWLAAREQTQPA